MRRVTAHFPGWTLGVALLCAAFAPIQSAFGDVIHFTSGRSKQGVIVDESESTITLQTRNGTMGIPRSAVEKIERASEEDNQALRREWYMAERREERERERRRAQREAREEAEAVAQRGMVEVDGEMVTRAQAERQAQAEANQREANRQRVEKFRREQRALPEDERSNAPLIFQEVRFQRNASGTTVTGNLLNVTNEAYRNLVIEVLLVEAPRTEGERVLSRQVLTLPAVAAENLEPITTQFPIAVPEDKPVEARMQVKSSTPPV